LNHELKFETASSKSLRSRKEVPEMLNSLYALVLTDSLHLPTTIGYFNTRPAACQARQSARAWLDDEFRSVESLNCFSNAAMNILDQCRTAIEKNPAHYIDLRVKPADDLSDLETTPFRVYYETATGDRHFTVLETVTDLAATRIVSHTVPNCTVIVTAFPDEHVETVGYTEVKPEMLDALALHQPKPTAASLAEFAKLAESGTISRSQFETFAYHAVNSPLPNESSADLKATADTLRKALDEGTQIIL
jgi:hypothetical protein